MIHNLLSGATYNTAGIKVGVSLSLIIRIKMTCRRHANSVYLNDDRNERCNYQRGKQVLYSHSIKKLVSLVFAAVCRTVFFLLLLDNFVGV